MKPSLPILTLVGLVGMAVAIAVAKQADPPTELNQQTLDTSEEATSQTQAQSLLAHAIVTLERHRSVVARIRQSVDLFGHKPVGTGIYLEQRSQQGVLLRMSLRIQVGDQTSSLLHVCDGRDLWQYRNLSGKETLTRIDVARVRRALGESSSIDRLDGIGNWIGLGGMPKLLRGLYGNFDFTLLGNTSLTGQVPVAVWKLQGQWKPEKLMELLPDQETAVREGRPLNLGKLPLPVPHQVVLYLGRADEFPYRVEYLRSEPDTENGNSPRGRAINTIEFIEVNLNTPIHPSRFVYNPGDLEDVDETGHFLKSLGLGE